MADPQRPPSAVLTPARCATPAALYLELLRHSLTHTLWSARAEAVDLRSPRLPLRQRLCGKVADRALKTRDLRLAVRLRTCEMTRRTRRHVLTGWSGRERDVHPSAGAAVRLVSLIVLVSLAAVGCSPTEPVPPSAFARRQCHHDGARENARDRYDVARSARHARTDDAVRIPSSW